MPSLHQIRTHPEFVDGCWGCKIATLKVGYCGQGGQDYSRQKAWDSELSRYESAVKSGIQPETTKTKDIVAAESWSNRFGKAYSSEAAQVKKIEVLRELVE